MPDFPLLLELDGLGPHPPHPDGLPHPYQPSSLVLLDDPPDLPDFPDPDPPLLPDFPLLELDGSGHAGGPHDGLPHPQSQSSEELDDDPPLLPDFPDDDDEQSHGLGHAGGPQGSAEEELDDPPDLPDFPDPDPPLLPDFPLLELDGSGSGHAGGPQGSAEEELDDLLPLLLPDLPEEDEESGTHAQWPTHSADEEPLDDLPDFPDPDDPPDLPDFPLDDDEAGAAHSSAGASHPSSAQVSYCFAINIKRAHNVSTGAYDINYFAHV